MVPEEGLEPSRTHVQQILSLSRLPLRHSGQETKTVYHNRLSGTTGKLARSFSPLSHCAQGRGSVYL